MQIDQKRPSLKLKIIKDDGEVKVYSVPDLSMFDFQEWQELNEVEFNLNRLLHAIKKLNSNDSETNEPISNLREVDFYLPDPIKNRALPQYEAHDGDSMVQLKSSTMLSAVVTEILQNHHPHSDYKVRISDG